MITEIDALEFLSVLALEELSETNQSLKWEYADICTKARRIESMHPSIQINLDSYFIESFRLRSAEHIFVGLHDIEIRDMPFSEISTVFMPCVPAENEYETIKSALGYAV